MINSRLFQFLDKPNEFFGFGITIDTRLIIDPISPRIEPSVIVPVAIRITSALQPFDIIQIFIFAGFAELIWKLATRRRPARSGLDLGPAFFAFEAAARALQDPAHGNGFLLAPQCSFFFSGKLNLPIKGNDIGQRAPPGFQGRQAPTEPYWFDI
jgi:hypothetical protein